MNISAFFIRRPVASTLLATSLTLFGILAFFRLPVAPLPQVDFPAINVQLTLPGANPDVMATTIAAPLERTLGRISGVEEMTSRNSSGQTFISLVFSLERDIDGAARDVMAAINAARSLLPSNLPFNPTYRRFNVADAPILVLALTSGTLPPGKIYDAASTIVAQQISQIDGVGQVTVGGSSLPAVRVDLNPAALNQLGVSPETVRSVIAATNANRPKGYLENNQKRWTLIANDQAATAQEYRSLVIAWKNNLPIRLQDVAQVSDSVQDVRNIGLAGDRRAVLMLVSRQPNANIIETVQRVLDRMPVLKASIPHAIDIQVVLDRSPAIKNSLHDVELSLLLSTLLVITVVYLFLRNVRATIIPGIIVPVSLLGTFALMWLAHYSLDNLSLMALTIATGFVVDDAIVMLENIARHIEKGVPPLEAALLGSREVGFTIISISLSLVAVFIPLLLMSGLIGRMFREFGVVLSGAVLISMVLSLTTTPMMCSRILKKTPEVIAKPSRLELGYQRLIQSYHRSLTWSLRHKKIILTIFFASIALNVFLFIKVPKGFFPQQDTGRIVGQIQADQSISYQAMRSKLQQLIHLCQQDPAVKQVIGFTGGDARNTGMMFIILKDERNDTAEEVINRLRKKLSQVEGAHLYLQAIQDLRFGGRVGNAQFQYTIQGSNEDEIKAWTPKIMAKLSSLPELVDVSTDQQDRGQSVFIDVDHDTAERLGITAKAVDQVLDDLFGQRIISTVFYPLNQYRVIMEAAPDYWQSSDILNETFVTSSTGAEVPLGAIAHFQNKYTDLTVNHDGQFTASTITFNLATGKSLSQATDAIVQAMQKLSPPPSLQGVFSGNAKVFKSSQSGQLYLIMASILAVYVILGILYESFIHPITILSTLPPAGVGALLALVLFHSEFDLMSLIGYILLIGIVKKNAIMMIDFALTAEREEQLSPEQAILKAAERRLRPIMMTTWAALLGAIPLATGLGSGGELRQPLGISLVGGLILSQLLTLYTTPVIYLVMENARQWVHQFWRKRRHASPIPKQT